MRKVVTAIVAIILFVITGEVPANAMREPERVIDRDYECDAFEHSVTCVDSNTGEVIGSYPAYGTSAHTDDYCPADTFTWIEYVITCDADSPCENILALTYEGSCWWTSKGNFKLLRNERLNS